MLPLTLRPTAVRMLAAFTDWSVLEDGHEVGHIYKQYEPSRPEHEWFWSITARIPNPTRAPTTGHAATFEEAKAQFREHWFRVWKRAPA